MKNNFEIPKRNSYSFDAVGVNTAERSPMQSLLSRMKLSNLRAKEFASIPFPGQSPIKAAAVCVNCKGKLPERDFLKAKVCEKCVMAFAVIGAEFDRHSDEKAKANRLKMFAVK